MGVHRIVKQMKKGDSNKQKKIVTFEKWLTVTLRKMCPLFLN
jgi:hypothetical protein